MIPEQPKVRHSFSFLLGNLINKQLIQRADCDTYLLVRLPKSLSKIIQTLLSELTQEENQKYLFVI